jgi:GNAT superfamily N-acetyltransferase
MTGIVYARETDLSSADYIAVVGETYMRDSRPIGNPSRVDEMLSGSNFVVTAREADGTIVGLARGMNDGAWVCYCADLAVRESYQGKGIGKALLDKMAELLGPRVGIALIAYPEAAKFYRKIGLDEYPGFFRERNDQS